MSRVHLLPRTDNFAPEARVSLIQFFQLPGVAVVVKSMLGVMVIAIGGGITRDLRCSPPHRALTVAGGPGLRISARGVISLRRAAGEARGRVRRTRPDHVART